MVSATEEENLGKGKKGDQVCCSKVAIFNRIVSVNLVEKVILE